MFTLCHRPAPPRAASMPLSRLWFGMLLALLLVGPLGRPALAESQKGGLPALEDRVTVLETTVSSQQTQINKLMAALALETARAQAAETTLQSNITTIARTPGPTGPQGPKGDTGATGPQGLVGDSPFTVSGTAGQPGALVTLTGYNLQIVNGTNSTGTINGLGNLIVGYNESRQNFGSASADNRTGSHNLIVGYANNYSSFGGLVAGDFNNISNDVATVTGGEGNTASGLRSSVSGGEANVASGIISSVTGG
jgi:hypothetical protein